MVFFQELRTDELAIAGDGNDRTLRFETPNDAQTIQLAAQARSTFHSLHGYTDQELDTWACNLTSDTSRLYTRPDGVDYLVGVLTDFAEQHYVHATVQSTAEIAPARTRTSELAAEIIAAAEQYETTRALDVWEDFLGKPAQGEK